VRIRDATPADAPAIAAVHVASWKAAYRGMIPDHYLERLTVDDRLAQWERALEGPPAPGHASLVAQDDAATARGFARVGPSVPAAGRTGELWALYLEPGAWGRGAGRALAEAAIGRMVELGYEDAVLWVLPENRRARRFYEIGGWQCDEVERTQTVWGVDLAEVRYRRRLV